MMIDPLRLSDREFRYFSDFIYAEAGISLGAEKRVMIEARLGKRLREQGLGSFSEYARLLEDPGTATERQIAINLLSTNETSFFREPEHFKWLASHALPGLRGRPVRCWSAASSSGEEAYTLAMQLYQSLEWLPWEILATDINTRVLDIGRQGMYQSKAALRIPADLASRCLLRGSDEYRDFVLIDRRLRDRVSFRQHNLCKSPPAELGQFHIIMLRNVLIYFDQETRKQVIDHLCERLEVGGWLIVGHAESLHSLPPKLIRVRNTIYQKRH